MDQLKDLKKLSIFRKTVLLENKQVLSLFRLKFLWIQRVISVKEGSCVSPSKGLTNWPEIHVRGNISGNISGNIQINVSGLNRKRMYT